MRASAWAARRWKNTGRKKMSWLITPGPPSIFFSSFHSAPRNWRASPPGATSTCSSTKNPAGNPCRVKIDFDSLGQTPEVKDTVTLRDRDTMRQIRVKIDELEGHLLEKIR